jgi:uncharacterized membrane protein (DUF4010 family)
MIGAGLSLRHHSGAPPYTVTRGRAFNLSYAVAFAVLLSALSAAMGYLAGRFGTLALPVGAAVTGFFDVHAAATSVLSVAAASAQPANEVDVAVMLAFTTNTISKLFAAVSAGGFSYGVRVAVGLGFVALAVWAPLLWRII